MSNSSKNIIEGWPDAIRCGFGHEGRAVFLIDSVTAGTNAWYYQLHDDKQVDVVFDSDGSYIGKHGHDSLTRGCLGQSIDQLYKSGRAKDFVTSKEPDSSGASTMIKGWPDAIKCSDSADGAVLWLHGASSSVGLSYYVQNVPHSYSYVRFQYDGAYHDRIGDTSAGCLGQSISQLYDTGKAYNLVDSKVKDDTGKSTMIGGWPDAIRCGVKESNGVVFLLNGAMDSSGKVWYVLMYSVHKIAVAFNSDGAYNGVVYANEESHVEGCIGKSIKQLYDAGRAFNFVGAPSTTSTSSTTTGSSATDTSVTSITKTSVTDTTDTTETSNTESGTSVTSITKTSVTDTTDTTETSNTESGTSVTSITKTSVTDTTDTTETSNTESGTSVIEFTTSSTETFDSTIWSSSGAQTTANLNTTFQTTTIIENGDDSDSSSSHSTGVVVGTAFGVAAVALGIGFFAAKHYYSKENEIKKHDVPAHHNPVYDEIRDTGLNAAGVTGVAESEV